MFRSVLGMTGSWKGSWKEESLLSNEEMQVKSHTEYGYKFQGKVIPQWRTQKRWKFRAGLMWFMTKVQKVQASQQNAEGKKNIQRLAYTSSYSGTLVLNPTGT